MGISRTGRLPRAALLFGALVLAPLAGGCGSGGAGEGGGGGGGAWAVSRVIPTGISLLQAVATDGTNVFVTSTLEPTIYVFSLMGSPLRTLTLNSGFGTNLSGMVVDRAGTGSLWVADTGPDRIFELNPVSGAVLRSIDVSSRSGAPAGLDVSGSTLFVTDSTAGRLLTVDTQSGAISSYVVSAATVQPRGVVLESAAGSQLSFTVVDGLFGDVKSLALDTQSLAVSSQVTLDFGGHGALPFGLCRLDATTYLMADQFTGNVLVLTR